MYHGEQNPSSYTVDDPLPYYENEKVPGMIQMKRTNELRLDSSFILQHSSFGFQWH